METATIPPYLTLSEASEFVYGDPEKQGYLFRLAEWGEFPLCWRVPHETSEFLIVIEEGVLLEDAQEPKFADNRLVALSPRQVSRLINENEVSPNLNILIEDSGSFSLFLPNRFEFVLHKGLDVRDITYPVPDYVQMDLYPYLEADVITPEQLYVRREDVVAFKDGKSLRQLTTPSKDELATKTKNTYLKVIRALSIALTDGLTDEPYKNADVILAALATKGIEAPTVPKTLAGYLKEAQDL